MIFTRYAIYYLPPADVAWNQFASRWLGWDIQTGAKATPPNSAALDIAELTTSPRRYGVHATLKSPMQLAQGQSCAALKQACAALASSQPPLRMPTLQLVRLGRFLALCPSGDQTALKALAAACMIDLDHFRAAATPAELARRSTAALKPAQRANLAQWGAAHVLDDFRFHITLTSKLTKDKLAAAEAVLTDQLLPLLPSPFDITDLALVGEAIDGRFHLIQRYPLQGEAWPKST